MKGEEGGTGGVMVRCMHVTRQSAPTLCCPHSRRYDERFVGFGWNKIAYAWYLRHRGVALRVLASGFLVHQGHAPSPSLVAFRDSARYRECMSALLDVFKRENQDSGRRTAT